MKIGGMKIGYVQTAPDFARKEKNYRQIAMMLQGTRADLIVLPELFATGYTFASKREAEDLAEELNGETTAFLESMAKETGAVVVGGFIERDGKHLYNASAMVCPSGILDCYRKIHLFNKEKIWFTPGNRKLRVIEYDGSKLGMMICFDWIFPEAARTLALLGADVIAHPANLVMPYCQKAMVTRCLENRVFAVTANRVGRESRGDDSFVFTGQSQITAFDGEVLSSAPKTRKFSAVVHVELEKARNKRINPYNDLFVDRRERFYGF
jgi:predicted amidohydrolase